METGISKRDLAMVVKGMTELGADTSVIKQAGMEAAQLLVLKALPLVPVKTGRLKGAVEAVGYKYGGAARVLFRKVPYANPIHWGWAVVSTRHKGVLKPGTYRGIPPQPFFSEALGYTEDEINRNYERLLQEYIDKLPGVKR